MKSYSIESFDPPNVSDEAVWDNFFQFYLTSFEEIYPDDPPTPKARLIKSLKDPLPHYYSYH